MQVIQMIDSGFVNDIRQSIDQSIINKNSIQLSLPYKITNFVYTLDLNGFYLADTSNNFIVDKNFNYKYWFGGCIPRLTFGYPLTNQLEFWISANYFKGPADLWLNLYGGNSQFEYKNLAIEFRTLLFETHLLAINLITQGNISSESSITSTTEKTFNIVKVNWLGNEEIQYNSTIITFPTMLQLSTKFENFALALSGGVIVGNLKKTDYFARNGIIGPIFGDSGFFRLNVNSSKELDSTFLQPVLGFYGSYNLNDNLGVVLGIQPNINLTSSTMSLRLVILN